MPVSVSGGLAGLTTACRAYAADVSDRGAARSIHMGMLQVSVYIGSGLGSSLGSFLYSRTGAAGPFIAYLFCSLFNILYISLRIKESVKGASSEAPVAQRLRALFDLNSLARIWRALSRKREGSRRRLLLIYVGAFTCDVIIVRECDCEDMFCIKKHVDMRSGVFLLLSARLSTERMVERRPALFFETIQG